ncbi:hypothetical protein MRQ47_004455 [Salmonella enterica]|nr:hypothetical protein [Salmonella enterica]
MTAGTVIAGVLAAGLIVILLRQFERTYRELVQERHRRKMAEHMATVNSRNAARAIERLLSCAVGTSEGVSQGIDESALRERLEAVITTAEEELDRFQ